MSSNYYIWFDIMKWCTLRELATLRSVSHDIKDIVDDGRLIRFHMNTRHNITGNWLPLAYVMSCASLYSNSTKVTMDLIMLKYSWNWRSHPYRNKFFCSRLVIMKHGKTYHCIADGKYFRFKYVVHDRLKILVDNLPYGIIELHPSGIELNDAMCLMRHI